MEASESERIFLTPSYIDSVIFGILEDEVKELADAALGEILDVEEVPGVDLEDN